MRAAIVSVAILAACGGRRDQAADEAPAGAIVVATETIVIRRGAVGIKETQDATYVLADVENRSGEDRRVAVDGVLIAADGRELGPLTVDELRIPRHDRRTFALLFSAVADGASSARLRVASAAVDEFPAPVVTTDLATERDGDALAATMRIRNTLDRSAVATLIATFYDAQGKIVGRPFTVLGLDPNSSRPFRFQGPKTAQTARVFVGDVVF